MFKASPFKLQMYQQCPRQYKFHYIDLLAKKYEKPKPYLTMGSNVHDALRIFLSMVSTQDMTYKKLEEIFKSAEKTRKYIKWTVIVSLFVILLPLLVLPFLAANLFDIYRNIGSLGL